MKSSIFQTIWTYFKPLARGLLGIATILGGCFTAGWGGAWGLQKVFDTQLSRAELRMDQKIINSENKILGIQKSEMESVKGQLTILIDLNKTMLTTHGIPLPPSARKRQQ
jgi:hypothetical protein